MTRSSTLLSLAWYLVLFLLLRDHARPRELILIRPVQLALSPDGPNRLAVQVLGSAVAFKSSAVGFAAVTPTEVLAWRILLDSPKGETLFREVYARASGPAGRLWALAGLRVVAPAAFERFAATLESGGDEVQTVVGCIVGTERVAVLVRELREYEWIRGYLTGWRSNSPWPIRSRRAEDSSTETLR